MLKLQVLAATKTSNIICIAVFPGRTHDFNLFKESKLHIRPAIELLADKGYLGIPRLHKNSTLPIKASKKHKLTAEEKAYNRMISKRRIYIEHINRYIKRFRILSSRYRNRRKRFGLRDSLICGIYNFQH